MKSKKLLSALSLGAAVLMLTSALTGCSSSSSSVLSSNKDYALKVVSDFSSKSKANEFEFSDKAFAKANLVAMMFKSDTTAEEMQELARNLFLSSITVTNDKGEIVASYPEGAESGKIKESKDKSMFNKIVKGISEKLMNDPAYNADADNYSVLAGVTRKDEGGAVIVGFDTTDYSSVTGSDLAKSCGANAVVIKDDAVISSTLDGVGVNTKLEDYGVSSDDLSKDSFTIKTDDKSYTATAGTKGDYTVICAAAN